MALIAPVTRGVSEALEACVGSDGLTGVHPGLVLDKFARSWDDTGDTRGLSERVQRPTIDQVVKLSAAPPPGLPFDALAKRWEALTAGALAFDGTTAGPLTLHLARASALENAGICLHPIYGFTYLPGSGLKGLARAFAETVAKATDADVRAVFGHVGDTSAAGAVVFHDAWPRAWPKLTCDILNSHHAEYYSKGAPPGDWEDPVPVYFLSVPAGVAFRFALAKRRDDVPTALLERAADWLAGGLTVLGCGAKTATGYGHFHKLTRTPATVAAPERPKFATQLELVTPAFLAGAQQGREDCDLRSATLRGQLRWWWRTLHAGFVTTAELQRMEAAVWGDTTRGGAVRTTVTAAGPISPQLFQRNEVIRAHRLPKPPDQKTSQGLTYHSYGMDEKKEGRQVTRYYLAPGTKWAAELTARPAQLAGARPKEAPRDLPADLVLAQAKAALALLCRFGGVGAKCRKGFGSLAATGLPTFAPDALKRDAAAFRAACDVGVPQFQDELATSPALGQMLPVIEVKTEGANYWLALDALAASAQQFAKKYKHNVTKKALGLPRRVGAPTTGRFVQGAHVKERHASPVLYHFDRGADGKLVARAVAFPARELPNLADSRKLLGELLAHLGGDLPGRFAADVKGTPPPNAPRVPPESGPVQGTRVKARVVADPKGKNRPFADARGKIGIIEGVPADRALKVDEEIEVFVKSVSADRKQVTYRWL
jgi:CRISPR-associated protein Cmr6